MKTALILSGILLCLLFAFVGAACCKASGDADDYAHKKFEEWMKAKQSSCE